MVKNNYLDIKEDEIKTTSRIAKEKEDKDPLILKIIREAFKDKNELIRK